MKDNFKKQIKSVFDYNKDAKEVFVTSDNQIFLNENLAKSHSVRLDGRKRNKKLDLLKVPRSDFENMNSNKDETPDITKSNEDETSDETKTSEDETPDKTKSNEDETSDETKTSEDETSDKTKSNEDETSDEKKQKVKPTSKKRK